MSTDDDTIDSGRRAFFRRAMHETAETVVREAHNRANRRAARWIRPPFALDELEFLMSCTRCGECIEVCPHRVIFQLPAHLGASVVATPALDLLNRGCHLCDDWPCVQVCEPGSLRLPPDDTVAPPLLAKASIDTDRCLAYLGPDCGACAASCPVSGALRWDGPRPVIDTERCTGCGLCRQACIVDPKAVRIESVHRPPSADVA